MPDISMCPNKTCPSKWSCYRYNATPSQQARVQVTDKVTSKRWLILG